MLKPSYNYSQYNNRGIQYRMPRTTGYPITREQRAENNTDDCNRCDKCECDALMKKIYAVDFAIQETVLYLNAYPDSCEALNYYNELVCQRKGLVENYEKNCGPLTMYGNMSNSHWDWIKGPWPWQYK